MPDQQSTEIEVEVVEIDGVAPVVAKPVPEQEARSHDWQDWRHWQGRVTRLDSRWWPLWVFLGMIALVLLLGVGLVIAVLYVVLRLIGRLLRAVLR